MSYSLSRNWNWHSCFRGPRFQNNKIGRRYLIICILICQRKISNCMYKMVFQKVTKFRITLFAKLTKCSWIKMIMIRQQPINNSGQENLVRQVRKSINLLWDLRNWLKSYRVQGIAPLLRPSESLTQTLIFCCTLKSAKDFQAFDSSYWFLLM